MRCISRARNPALGAGFNEFAPVRQPRPLIKLARWHPVLGSHRQPLYLRVSEHGGAFANLCQEHLPIRHHTYAVEVDRPAWEACTTHDADKGQDLNRMADQRRGKSRLSPLCLISGTRKLHRVPARPQSALVQGELVTEVLRIDDEHAVGSDHEVVDVGRGPRYPSVVKDHEAFDREFV